MIHTNNTEAFQILTYLKSVIEYVNENYNVP